MNFKKMSVILFTVLALSSSMVMPMENSIFSPALSSVSAATIAPDMSKAYLDSSKKWYVKVEKLTVYNNQINTKNAILTITKSANNDSILTIPDKLSVSIDDYNSTNKIKLENITVKKINANAFTNVYNSNLTNITIPSSVEFINIGAFNKLPNLENINISKDYPKYATNNIFSSVVACEKFKSINKKPLVVENTTTGEPNLNPDILNFFVDIPLYDMSLNPSKYPQLLNYYNDKVSYIVKQCKASSDLLTAKNLHNWIIKNVKYDKKHASDKLFSENKSKLSSVNNPYSFLLRIVMDEKENKLLPETVCCGYAKAYTALLTEAGIQSESVIGYESDMLHDGHEWNKIYLENIKNTSRKWFHVDVCWDDDDSVGNTIKYDYFLKTDSDFDKDGHSIYNWRDYELNSKNHPAVINKALLGDANGTNDVNLSDAVAIKQSLANPTKYPLKNKLYADFNLDGDINNEDADAIQKAMLYRRQNNETVFDVWLRNS